MTVLVNQSAPAFSAAAIMEDGIGAHVMGARIMVISQLFLAEAAKFC